MPTKSSDKQLLLIGASRGLGFALAEEYLKRGWHVVATERDSTNQNCTIYCEPLKVDSKSRPSTLLIQIRLPRCERVWH